MIQPQLSSLLAVATSPPAFNVRTSRTAESNSVKLFLRRLCFGEDVIAVYHECAESEGVELCALENAYAIPQYVEDTLADISRYQLSIPVAERSRQLSIFGFGGAIGSQTVDEDVDMWEVCHQLIWETVPMYQLINIDTDAPLLHDDPTLAPLLDPVSCQVQWSQWLGADIGDGKVHHCVMFRAFAEAPTLPRPVRQSSSSSSAASSSSGSSSQPIVKSAVQDHAPKSNVFVYYHATFLQFVPSILAHIEPQSKTSTKDFYIPKAFYIGNSWSAAVLWCQDKFKQRCANSANLGTCSIIVFELPKAWFVEQCHTKFQFAMNADHEGQWRTLVSACRTSRRRDAKPWQNQVSIFGPIAILIDKKWEPHSHWGQLAVPATSDELLQAMRHHITRVYSFHPNVMRTHFADAKAHELLAQKGSLSGLPAVTVAKSIAF